MYTQAEIEAVSDERLGDVIDNQAFTLAHLLKNEPEYSLLTEEFALYGQYIFEAERRHNNYPSFLND